MKPNRVVALLTPLVAAAAAWAAGWVFQHTGVRLDDGLLTAIMLGQAAAVVAMADRWLKGWQLHEDRLGDGR